MNELMFRDPFANMFKNLEAIMDFDFGRESRGLKKYIPRPHDLLTVKDENGKVKNYEIHVVYTPFRKDEVKVEAKDNVLTVKCGSENKIENKDMDYCGISHQSYEFSLPLSDTIDMNAIEAKAEDGILYITLPVKAEEEKKDNVKMIEVK